MEKKEPTWLKTITDPSASQIKILTFLSGKRSIATLLSYLKVISPIFLRSVKTCILSQMLFYYYQG